MRPNSVSSSPHLSMSSSHFLVNMLANSLTHLLATHLEPTTTGHPLCSMCMSVRPLRLMLCQKMAAPLMGETDTPSLGKAVWPPLGTFVPKYEKLRFHHCKCLCPEKLKPSPLTSRA